MYIFGISKSPTDKAGEGITKQSKSPLISKEKTGQQTLIKRKSTTKI